MAMKKNTTRVSNGDGLPDDEHKEAGIQAEFERLERKGWDRLTLREKTFMAARITYVNARKQAA